MKLIGFIVIIVISIVLGILISGSNDEKCIKHVSDNEIAQAVKPCTESAKNGFSAAQYILGVMHNTGEGVPKNYGQAVNWFRLAAEQGHAGAQYDLGYAYSNAQGVEQNYNEAFQWYLKSAQQGYSIAQHNLGLMYMEGNGVPQDFVKAYAWLNTAYAQGYKTSGKGRDMLADQMQSEQLMNAKQLAIEYQEQYIRSKVAGAGKT